MRKAVFLDRDGVLNRAYVRNGVPHPPASSRELEILDEARVACRSLRDAGFLLICVTNQPDLSRGTADPAGVAEINDIVQRELGLDAMFVCPHDDADRCDCRKPKPGLMVRAAASMNIDLGRSFMIGDRWRDVDAGRSAGCRTVFVDRSYGERLPETYDAKVASTSEGAEWIVNSERSSRAMPATRAARV